MEQHSHAFAEQKLTKAYYSIGEVADMLTVNTSLIRFWETKFDELSPKKTRGGNRLYTPKEVETLRLIYFLVKTKGYTLRGAQEKLKVERLQLEAQRKAIETLQSLRDFLMELKEAL
jgi:DNA-binding transcriptional MerR regulator